MPCLVCKKVGLISRRYRSNRRGGIHARVAQGDNMAGSGGWRRITAKVAGELRPKTLCGLGKAGLAPVLVSGSAAALTCAAHQKAGRGVFVELPLEKKSGISNATSRTIAMMLRAVRSLRSTPRLLRLPSYWILSLRGGPTKRLIDGFTAAFFLARPFFRVCC
jgi:hypothetical protein